MEIKMTKKLLNDYQKTKRELPILENELRMMLQGDNGFDNSTILDYRKGYGRPQSVVGFDWELYECREQILVRKEAEVRAVEQWIDAIEDGQVRCVFRMYYMEGMNWVKIAMKTCYSGNEDYPRKMIRDKYLKKCGIK